MTWRHLLIDKDKATSGALNDSILSPVSSKPCTYSLSSLFQSASNCLFMNSLTVKARCNVRAYSIYLGFDVNNARCNV